ncbi:hypothetical protein ACLMJK_003540 [Lecanora helva]
MSTAAGSSRVLRSASKARSEASSVPRSRGRVSRRGSPAGAANAPEDDHDRLPFNLQSYGTTGRPAELQMQSEEIARRQALDPIASAVSGAEAASEQSNANPGGLAAVPEASESEFHGSEDNANDFLPNFVQPQEDSFFARISNSLWAPHQPDEGTENQAPLVLQHRARLWGKYIILFLMTLLFGLLGYNLPYLISQASHLATYLPTGSSTPEFANLTFHDYKLLKHRVEKLEHYVHSLPSISSSSKPADEELVNWFTPGFGPTIDVGLSSPTTTYCDPTWKPWPFRYMYWQKCLQKVMSPPPMMALQHWDDPAGDRWCAPRSGGKLQLAIQTRRPIMPTNLVVEYMLKQASPSSMMTMAPKEFELWIRVPDDDLRAKVSVAIAIRHPELHEDSSPQGRDLHNVKALDEEYVRIGRWTYNIYLEKSAQVFSLLGPLLETGVTTDKFVIRVNSNWGNVDFTCINRFKMYGLDASGIFDYLEQDPAVVR